ncbi:hypothetical protein A1O7_04464 [Cladophialophora yegresii CBS 114405]|uniref:Non-haem dioxygenase N-terminal domain-containing protein n=1 Tax=Cladophialophora yegresii CBS 114405 TaxID=1182544 RepID=W9VWV3_9EURO|nr:uncharacterized protein A1O7_04464 [Cladophialophora yegresii CBS 114405]EXJ60312.1 hypothetical protein A1O7_04464 [Cladophialophora yegresii CBS 114405]
MVRTSPPTFNLEDHGHHWTPKRPLSVICPVRREDMEVKMEAFHLSQALPGLHIPIIDFSRSTTNLSALAEEIKQVCATWGFLYLVNHGLPQPQIDRMFEVSATFFKPIPRAEKALFPWNSLANVGYDAKTGTQGYFHDCIRCTEAKRYVTPNNA